MDHELLLRRAIAISEAARDHGNHPFGALLATADGRIAAEAENTCITAHDVTGHAETNLVSLASQRFEPEELAGMTLVTSCEPCAMCSGAIYWSGIASVVYGLSEEALLELTGDDPENPTLNLPCRIVLGAGQRSIEVTGPLLEDEARRPHDGFWQPASA